MTDFDYKSKWNFWEPKTAAWDFDNAPSGVVTTDGIMVMTI